VQQQYGQQRPEQQQWSAGQWQWPWMPWGMPPCPYPSSPWARPNFQHGQHAQQHQPGILGSKPPQAYTTVAPPTPTDIEAAMHTLGLNPTDPNWYMDTGATSHMTSEQGNLSSYFNLSNNRGIIVSNGHSIPIRGYGHTNLSFPNRPLTLKNVLHSPQLIKNLVSVRKFTTDNSVSVEFDPFDFSVKDFQTGMRLMRCESRGDLYPITTSQAISPSTFAALAPSLWHARLGHPGAPVVDSLRKNKFIECNKASGSHICHSCSLGKHIKLSFVSSSSCTVMPFDIIHSDIWTSHVLSFSGHGYYVLFVDDYSNFLWTFPLSKKSQVFSIFFYLFEHLSAPNLNGK